MLVQQGQSHSSAVLLGTGNEAELSSETGGGSSRSITTDSLHSASAAAAGCTSSSTTTGTSSAHTSVSGEKLLFVASSTVLFPDVAPLLPDVVDGSVEGKNADPIRPLSNTSCIILKNVSPSILLPPGKFISK